VIKRNISKKIKELAKKYPVVTVTGPRQSGKTVLLREIFPNYSYVNLENLGTQEAAEKDPQGFLASFEEGVILDEVQKVPSLLSYIQVIVDERKKDGMFILSGSQNLMLLKSVNQSLAGRTALFELLPLSASELINSSYIKQFKAKKAKRNTQIKLDSERFNIDLLMYKGCFPKIYDKNIDVDDYYQDYLKTYLEKDLRDLKQIQDLKVFRNFMRMCATRVGQPLNLHNISSDLGVSSATLKQWLYILEACYIVFLLEPFNENLNKQIIKSPKLYFTDTGLVCHLLQINSVTELENHPLRGSIFENLIVIEALKERLNQHKPINMTYYKDKYHEVDLMWKHGNNYKIAEIKSAETVNREFFNGLRYLEKILGSRITEQSLIYGGSESYKHLGVQITNLEHLSEAL
jgi:predicted AAA+ superfamily ATPase